MLENTRTTAPALRTVTALSPGGTMIRLSPFDSTCSPSALTTASLPGGSRTMYSSGLSRSRTAPFAASLTTVTKLAARVIQCRVPSVSVLCGGSA